MAASTAATMAVSGAMVGSMRSSSELGSSRAYGSRFLQVAPFRPTSTRLSVVAKATLPEESAGKPARREILAGLMAVSAAIMSSGSALASTKDKAQDLLRNADELTNTESPTRFGPAQAGDSNPGTVAQKGGAGAIEELQGGTTNAVDNARKTVEEAKGNIEKMLGGKKGASIPDLGFQSPDLGDVKSKVKSDISTTEGKVKSDIATTEQGAKGLTEKLNGGKGTPGSIIADAQSKVGDASNDIRSKGQSVFDKLQNKSFNLIPQ